MSTNQFLWNQIAGPVIKVKKKKKKLTEEQKLQQLHQQRKNNRKRSEENLSGEPWTPPAITKIVR